MPWAEKPLIALLLRKELLEEEELIVYAVVPILRIVGTGTQDEIVVDATAEQTLVERLVALEEEVALATVDDDVEVMVLDAANLVDHHMGIPALAVVSHLAERPLYLPVLREATEVYTTTHAATGAIDILVAERQIERAMTTHAQSRHCATLAVGDGAIVAVDILDQFLGGEGFVLQVLVDGAVYIPRVERVGGDEYHALLVGYLGERGLDLLEIILAVARGAVEQIEHRIALVAVFLGLGGCDDHRLDILVHHRAVYQHRIYLACLDA